MKILRNAEQYATRRRLHRIWRRFVGGLACLVVFATTYMLILPAIALENQAICGMEEHVHTEECNTTLGAETLSLNCSMDTLGIHQHTDECLDEEGLLICGLADYVVHVHDSSCFDADGSLVCQLREIMKHQHTDACYENVLICGQKEAEPHIHTVECFDASGVLACGLLETYEHVHSDSCFVREEQETLICQIPEHTHSQECFVQSEETENDSVDQNAAESADSQSIDTQLADEGSGNAAILTEEDSEDLYDSTTASTDTAIDVSSYIVANGTVLRYKTDEDTLWQSIGEDTRIPGDAMLRLDVAYEGVPLADLLANGGILTYDIPDIFYNPGVTGDGNVTDKTGAVIGTISMSNYVLTVEFKMEWLQGLQKEDSATVDGTFYIESAIDLSKVPDEGTKTIQVGNLSFNIQVDKNVVIQYGSGEISKSGPTLIQAEDGDYLEYTLTVTASEDGCSDVKIVDYFSANGSYVQYVGLTTSAADLTADGSPSETIAEGKSHGKVYNGALPTEDTPIPPENGTVEEPGSLVWVIGDMDANEIRTLTYKVKLKDRYTYIQNSESGVVSNTANAYSSGSKKDSDTVSYEPKGTLNVTKRYSNDATLSEDGTYYTLTYTIVLQAPSTNTFTLEDVRIEDTFDATNDSWQDYIEYVADSFKLYSKNYVASNYELTFPTSETLTANPVINGNSFTAYIGDLEPGEYRCIRYQITVQKEALPLAGQNDNGIELRVINKAFAYSGNAKSGEHDYLGTSTANGYVRYYNWASKEVGDPIEDELKIDISGTIYDATGSTLTTDTSGAQYFTVPAGSYRYTVDINKLGDWDVTSASMKDALGNAYMKFVGYVKVEAYEPNNNNAVKNTIWVKVEGKQSFNFTMDDLGMSDNYYAYRLTYYAQPVDLSDVSTVIVANSFTLSGEIGYGNGKTFILTGVKKSVSVTLIGGNNFQASKEAWYYEGAKTSTGDWSLGAIYWAIKVEGTDSLAKGTCFRDWVQPAGDHVFLCSDSLVGVYTGAFPAGKSIADYANMDDVLESGYLTEVDPSYYSVSVELNSSTTAASRITLQLQEDIPLDGKALYIIVKTAPGYLPNKNSYLDYANHLRTSDDGTNWADWDPAVKTLYNGYFVKKVLGGYWTYDGSTATRIDTEEDAQGGKVVADKLPEPGYYISYNVIVNHFGNLSGQYRVVDDLPDGLELVYVRLLMRGNSTLGPNGAYVPQITNLGEGWAENTITAVPYYEDSEVTTYYYTNGSQACWDIANLIAGGSSYYSVNCQVVCRIVDENVLLGGETKTFNNEVTLYNTLGQELDADSYGYEVTIHSIEKTAVLAGSTIPFTITVNKLGEDLLEGADTLTMVDELSDTLKLDVSTLTVVNSSTNVKVDVLASVDGQTLTIEVPDETPLTISYTAKVQSAPETEVAISNLAHWQGYAATDASSVEKENYSYSVGGTASGSTRPKVKIVKFDQYNATNFLSGAEFKMEEGTMTENGFTPNENAWTGTTGSDGTLIFGEEGTLMSYNTVYRITETKAPDGYILDETPHYFLVSDGKEDIECPSSVKIEYDDVTYTYEVPNRTGTAYVEKTFLNASGKSISSVKGTYCFGLFDNASGTGEPLQTTKLTYSAGNNTPTGNGRFYNLALDKTYYIFELDDNGAPIMNGNVGTVDSTPFIVHYESNEVKDGETVRISNQVCFEMPETGGTGTLPYTLTGLALLCSAAYLLFNRPKHGRGIV